MPQSKKPPPRKTRAVSREQAINQIIDIATQEFVEKGLAGARIDEIAGRATKRKIYYYFEGKDELFLAVLDDQNRRRRSEQIAEMQVAPTLAEALLAAGREMAGTHARDPQWTPLLVEFWTHASRDDALRARVSAAHEDLLDSYAAVVAELAARDGLEFTAPVKAVCRSAAALARGLALERLLDPGAVPEPDFGELFCAHILSRTRRVEP